MRITRVDTQPLRTPAASARQAPCKLSCMSENVAPAGRVRGGGTHKGPRSRNYIFPTPPITDVLEIEANVSVHGYLYRSLQEYHVDSRWTFKRERDFANCFQGTRRKLNINANLNIHVQLAETR